MNGSDKELVSEFLKNKGEETFRRLYANHTPALYLLALRLVGGSEPDAQDAIQETWIRAASRLNEFRWKSALRTWLSGILVNCTREIARRSQKIRENELDGGGDMVPAEVSGRVSQMFDLEQIIRRLPDGYRQILILHDLEGYTHKEIGRLLDINEGTSKSQLFHARNSVKESFRTQRSAINE